MFKKTLIPCLLLVLLLGPLSTVNAQDNVGIGTLSPSSDAILDLFSNNKGFLAPRVTSAERATIPANSSGLLVFDTDENKFFYWNSALSLWQVMDDFSNTNELLQIAAFDETTKQITLTDRGATYTLDLNILSQQLSFRNDTLFISDKNEIDLGIYNKDSSATNELQSLTISNDTIFIDRRGFIKLSEDEFWNTDGNVGTTPLTHFIGTIDNQDLIIKTDNTERVRILGPNGNFGIGTTTPDEVLDVQGNIELSGGNRVVHTQLMPPGNDNGHSITLKSSDHNSSTGKGAATGGNVYIEAGKGYNLDQANGGGHIYLRTGANDLTTNDGRRNGGYIIFETGGAKSARTERARMLDNGNFGLGTSSPSSQLDLTEQIRIRGGNPGNGKVLTSDANGLATWQKGIPSVSNGLNVNTGANSIRLGGPLVENTTITQGRFGIVFDQDNTLGLGDFTINSQGVAKFRVNAWGDTRFGSDVYFMDESVGGRRLVQITDEGPDNDDGRIRIFENGLPSVDLNAGRYFDFNQQRLDRNFKISSVGDENMFFLDASADRIGIGTTGPSTQLDLTEQIRIRGGNPGNGKVLTSDANGLATWQDVPVVENGLNKNTNTIRLGGPLVTNTTITQGTRNMIFNLNNSGDFIVQDNGVTQFTVQDNGRVGIGTTSPDEKLDVEGSGRFGIDGKLTINTRTTGLARVGNDGFLSGGRFVSYGPEIVALQTTIDDKNIGYDISSYGGGDKRHVLALQPDGGYVGIGTLTASSQLDLSEQIRIRGGNPGNGKVLTSDANGLATWQKGIPSVSNGLNVNTGANSIRLGGPLVETTTITQGRFGIVFDQDNTLGLGDFTIKSQGVAKFRVNAWGDTRFGSDVYFMDESVSGRRLVQITDEGPDNDDGRIRIFENGLSSVDLNAGRYFDFNQQRLDRNFKISSVGDENMFFLDASADRIGIGTSTPSQVLEVAGNILANGNLIRSDKRWKTKIELISNALEKLDQINGYTYKWKVGTDTTPQVGVIAQEIELVLPEAVKTDAEGYKSVDYGKLSALLIEAVKEQQTIITSLENKIDLQNTAISDVKNVQKSLDERLLILEKK